MRWLVLAAAAISLSGCGLPPIVTYISYTADVFSYLTTRKTVTDHGASFVLQKDCALLRVLDGPICVEETEAETAVREPAREHETRAIVATSSWPGSACGPAGATWSSTCPGIVPSARSMGAARATSAGPSKPGRAAVLPFANGPRH